MTNSKLLNSIRIYLMFNTKTHHNKCIRLIGPFLVYLSYTCNY